MERIWQGVEGDGCDSCERRTGNGERLFLLPLSLIDRDDKIVVMGEKNNQCSDFCMFLLSSICNMYLSPVSNMSICIY